MIVFGQVKARTKTNDYQAPFDQGFSKTISSELQKEAIDREFDRDEIFSKCAL